MGDGIPATAASPLTPAVDAGVRAQQQAAFRAARRKFALYGRQHAHVSHLSGQGGRGDKGNDAAALTNTLLLQENGALALHADDLQYRLDGILFQQQHTGPGVSDDEREERVVVARARNVVELARMLQRPDVQRMLKLSRPSARLCITRIHDVATLLRRRRTNACPDGGGTGKERSADELLRLSVAVLLFSLTLAGFECDEWFPREVLGLMAECLQHEFDAQILKEKKKKRSVESGHEADTRPVNDDDITQNADQSLPEENSPSHRRKTCLKRKKQSIQRRRSMSTSGDDDDAADPQGRLQRDVAALLNGHGGFGRIKQAPVTIADVLVMTLHNLLQMDTGYDQQQHNAHQRRKDVELAGATFATLRARKRQLLENNAMHVLVDMLAHQVQQLQWASVTAASSSSFAESSACSLQRIETILRVLDQASFLETEVQRQLSSSPGIFTILLELVEQLSKLCWGQPRQKHDKEACDKEKATFLQGDAVLVEVLLVSMRVLINLTHHNEDAARHIYGLHGMKTLFRSFCLLWEASESTTRSSDVEATADHEDKLLFDAFLMFLSALTNCVEFSPENRDAVMTIAVSRDETMTLGVEDLQIPSVCGVVTKFFLSKVQSYRRMLEWSDTNLDGGAFAPIENDENVQWVPEDVILGGCSSLLLGCLIKDSPSNAMQVLDVLPDQSPHLLLRALSAFVALHSQIGALTPEVGKSVLQVEQTFKSLLVQDGVRGLSTILADSNVTPALSLTISAKITMASTERTRRDATSLRESTTASKWTMKAKKRYVQI
uniref:Wings apart-like protein C-terminal domain-containing protein n=1 Tax=Globisporangium ultimum (strain ATCC 200006 / CBS 805.95 / DAOM BR144) TaxID=431595 RepID=K3WBY5_GLOUD